MLVYLDNIFPWLGDMLELGGDILLVIIVMAALMWMLIIERLIVMRWVLPRHQAQLTAVWQQHCVHQRWYTERVRQLLVSRLGREAGRHLELIRTIVKVCPLLGLLGTVLGMLEIFDALAVTGNNSARTTAGGVSKATVSTMAGMVVAISGLMVSNYLLDRAATIRRAFYEQLSTHPVQGGVHA